MSGVKPTPVEQRLLGLRTITESGCWEFGHNVKHHYPTMKVSGSKTTGDARLERVHRVAARLWMGWDGIGWILHKCDNKRCFNPDHLYVGSHQDNVRDSVERRRYRQGIEHHRRDARLTDAQVVTARSLRAGGLQVAAIARIYGVTPSSMSRIVNGLTYRHVGAAA